VLTGRPPWAVTLVCGASGAGKSSAASALAARYGVPLGEADDVVTALLAMTTPAHQPVLHYWTTHPDAASWPAERIADLHLDVAAALRPAFVAVIADHVESGAPVVLEGDYLTPDLVDACPGAVRAVVLDEPDEHQLAANYRDREQDSSEPRARVSVLLAARLVALARAAGVPVVPARPWADQVERIDRALRG